MLLALLSGGPDSTWALWNALQTEPVVAMHVSFQSNKNWRHELNATLNVVQWLQTNVRPFQFERRMINTGTMGPCLNVMFLAPFVADWCLLNSCDRVLFGECKEEMIRETAGGFTLFRPVLQACLENPDHKYLLQTMAPLIRTLPQMPELIRPGVNTSKKELFESMPKQLRELTWSCFNPTNEGKPCGTCSKCNSLKRL